MYFKYVVELKKNLIYFTSFAFLFHLYKYFLLGFEKQKKGGISFCLQDVHVNFLCGFLITAAYCPHVTLERNEMPINAISSNVI